MNTQQLVELITDAVTDAVREALPRMVATQLDAVVAQVITPALAKLDRALDVMDARVQERITDMQADFATRAIAQADALTASWQRQADAVRDALPRAVAEALDARVAQTITPALEKLDRVVDGVDARVQERSAAMQADFTARMAQAETLAASWQRQVDGLNEQIVERVAAAVAGIPSQAGAAGPPGPPGRDATMVSPVHWKTGQTFQRGSVVQHRGGLWFANVDTSAEPGTGVDGYGLMFDGHELAGYEYDERGYQVAIYRYASGREHRAATGFRPFRYAGVYDHATTYHLNDAVTANGCMWMCKAVHVTAVRPGTDEAARHWQLAVKSGRDGKDGAPGPKGDPGAQGPPGIAPPRPTKGKANGVTA